MTVHDYQKHTRVVRDALRDAYDVARRTERPINMDQVDGHIARRLGDSYSPELASVCKGVVGREIIHRISSALAERGENK